MKMTRREVVLMYNTLTALSNTAKGEFAYAVVKNLKCIEAEISAISKLEPERPQAVVEYEGKRQALINEYAEKDEAGAFIVKSNQYTIAPDKKDEFLKKHEELNVEYQKVLDEYQSAVNKYNSVDLASETDVNVFLIKKEYLPSDINAQDVFNLFNIIDNN